MLSVKYTAPLPVLWYPSRARCPMCNKHKPIVPSGRSPCESTWVNTGADTAIDEAWALDGACLQAVTVPPVRQHTEEI